MSISFHLHKQAPWLGLILFAGKKDQHQCCERAITKFVPPTTAPLNK